VDTPEQGIWKGRQHPCHQGGGLCNWPHRLVPCTKRASIKKEDIPLNGDWPEIVTINGAVSGQRKFVQMLAQVVEVDDTRRKLEAF